MNHTLAARVYSSLTRLGRSWEDLEGFACQHGIPLKDGYLGLGSLGPKHIFGIADYLELEPGYLFEVTQYKEMWNAFQHMYDRDRSGLGFTEAQLWARFIEVASHSRRKLHGDMRSTAEAFFGAMRPHSGEIINRTPATCRLLGGDDCPCITVCQVMRRKIGEWY